MSACEIKIHHFIILDALLSPFICGITLQFRSLSLLCSGSMKFNVFFAVICFSLLFTSDATVFPLLITESNREETRKTQDKQNRDDDFGWM